MCRGLLPRVYRLAHVTGLKHVTTLAPPVSRFRYLGLGAVRGMSANCRVGASEMDSTHREQMERLAQFRRTVEQNQQSLAPNDAAEVAVAATGERGDGRANPHKQTDPLIYAGLYAPSGFNIMSILVGVTTRPNPMVEIGNIDSSCALILCDSQAADMPIVYCSEGFQHLTGYSQNEVLGRNCRFLQSPDGVVQPGVKRRHVDDEEIYKLKSNIIARKETQTVVVNYKKGGAAFTNVLTTVPVTWNAEGGRYIVGFQAAAVQYYPVT